MSRSRRRPAGAQSPRVLIAPAVLLCALACAEGARESSHEGSSDAGPTASLDAVFSRLVFTVRGGIAGFDLELVVTPEGAATLAERGVPRASTTLADSVRAELRARLARAAPADPRGQGGRRSYGRAGRITDGWVRTITVEGAASGGDPSTTWSVEEISDPDAPLPASLRDLFDTLMDVTMRTHQLARTAGEG